MWSPPYDAGSTTLIYGPSDAGFERPAGLYQLITGDVLVADPLRNRILKVGAAGELGVWLDRAGAEPGQLACPLTFSGDPDDPDGTFWLVDRADHRLQRFDIAGRCQTVIGGFGPEGDCLFEPRALACFADGSLVVAEARNPACLVLITKDGRVTSRMVLGYDPGTPVADGDHLFVPDLRGDCINAYRRA